MFIHGNSFIGEGFAPEDDDPGLDRAVPPALPAASPINSHHRPHAPYTPPVVQPDPNDTRRCFYQYMSAQSTSWWHHDSRDDEAERSWLRREKGRLRVVLRYEGLPLPALRYDEPPPEGLPVLFSGVLPVAAVPFWPGDTPSEP